MTKAVWKMDKLTSDCVILCDLDVSPRKIAEKLTDDVVRVFHGGVEMIPNKGKMVYLHPDEKKDQELIATEWFTGAGNCLITHAECFNGLEASCVIYVQRQSNFSQDVTRNNLSRGVARLAWILGAQYDPKTPCKKMEI